MSGGFFAAKPSEFGTPVLKTLDIYAKTDIL